MIWNWELEIGSKKMRKVKFVTGEYYHIYNRGVDRRDIFLDEGDYGRFIKSIIEFNTLDPIGSLYEKVYKDKFRQEELSSQLGTELSSGRIPSMKNL